MWWKESGSCANKTEDEDEDEDTELRPAEI